MLNRIITRSWTDADGLLMGLKWGTVAPGNSVTLTYSFPSTNARFSYNDMTAANHYGLNPAQQEAFRQMLQSWSAVADINFEEVNDGLSYGDIRVAYSEAVDDDTSGLTYTLNNGVRGSLNTFRSDEIAGDIWLHTNTTETDSGSLGMHVLMHEIGHALGLKHPFESSFDNGYFPQLSSALDDIRYTVMSYTPWDSAGYTYTPDGKGGYTQKLIYPTTPMVYDILAIQYLYGANMATGAGDTTYRFATQGEFMTLWDASGNDTIDLSNQKIASWFDLTPGTNNDVGQAQLDEHGTLGAALYNIGIAFDCWIENLIGTAYDDVLWGNTQNNQITGGAGDDKISGGNGIDTALYSGSRDQYTFSEEGLYTYIEGPDGKDRLSSIEKLSFNGDIVNLDDALKQPAVETPAPTSASEVNRTPLESDKAWFLLELDSPITTDARVDFRTLDGSATAGEDYVATSGVATIVAGETQLAIGVELIDDNQAEGSETFSLVVSNPVGGVFANDALELVAIRTIIDNDTL